MLGRAEEGAVSEEIKEGKDLEEKQQWRKQILLGPPQRSVWLHTSHDPPQFARQ